MEEKRRRYQMADNEDKNDDTIDNYQSGAY